MKHIVRKNNNIIYIYVEVQQTIKEIKKVSPFKDYIFVWKSKTL